VNFSRKQNDVIIVWAFAAESGYWGNEAYSQDPVKLRPMVIASVSVDVKCLLRHVCHLLRICEVTGGPKFEVSHTSSCGLQCVTD